MDEQINFDASQEHSITSAEPAAAPQFDVPVPSATTPGAETTPAENEPTAQNTPPERPATLPGSSESFVEEPHNGQPLPIEPLLADGGQPSRSTNENQPSFDEIVEATYEERRGARRIAKIQQELGVVPALVPIHYRSKVPVLRGWNRLTSAYNELPEFVHMFGIGDRGIGVLLGVKSEGLIALDFDDIQALRKFLHLNLALRKTLTTCGARGATMWLIMSGPYPQSFDIKRADGKKGNLMEFRADGKMSIIRGRHPSGTYYQTRVDGPPLKISFSDIVWPDGWQIPTPVNEPTSVNPVLDDFDSLSTMFASTAADTSRFGEAFAVGEGGKIVIDEHAFADLFSAAYPIFYVPNLSFFVYNEETGCWDRAMREEVYRRLAMFLEHLARKYALPGFRKFRSVRRLADLTTIQKGLLAQEIPDRAYGLLHVANSMVDIDGDEPTLLPFSPHYYSRSASPVLYRPGAKCDRWLEALNYALPADDVDLLQEWAGLALSGFNSMQAVLILTGIGGAGKGVFVNVVSRIIGRQNCAELRTRHLNEKFENGLIHGKSLLIGSDVPGDFLNVAGAQRIKALTGHDELLAEIKYEPTPFSYSGTFNIVVTSNQNLCVALNGDEDAWARRLKIVHFLRKSPTVNPNFVEELLSEESSGILNWMIEGLMSLRRKTSHGRPWPLSSEQQLRIDDLLTASDSLRAFVRDWVQKADAALNVTTDELHLKYESMCDEFGWSAQTKHHFHKMLPQLMLQIHGIARRNDIVRGMGERRGFSGVQVRREPMD